MKVKLLFLATRPGFLTASAVPVLVGLAGGWLATQRFDPLGAAGILAAALLVHAGADMMNDYDDHASGADQANHEGIPPFSGGSRMIQMGALTPGVVRRTALALLGAGAALLGLLTLRAGPLMLLFGAIGLVSSLTYTGRPFSLASRGLGEVVVGLNFGPVLVGAGYYVQARAFAAPAMAAALPMAFLVMAILYLNEFPDYQGDRAAGKGTLVVRLGRRRASYGYAALAGLAYASIVMAVLLRQLPVQALIGLGSLPLGVGAARTVRRHYDEPVAMSPAIVQTIVNHLLTGLLLVVAFWSAAVGSAGPLAAGGGLAVIASLRSYAAMDGLRRAAVAGRG